MPPEAAAALDAAGSVRFTHPVTGAAFTLTAEADVTDGRAAAERPDAWDPDAEPLPTRAEVEARMGQTFAEALREARAELDAGGGVSLEEHRRLRQKEWAAIQDRLATERRAERDAGE